MDDLSWSNVLAGLIGGTAASVFTFAGAFYLQTHAQRRSRHARLLTDLCWRHNFVTLAADLPRDAYSDLRALYYMFPTSSDYFRLAKAGTATKEQLHWLQDWRRHLLTAQVFVEFELHITWKLWFPAKRLLRRITRLIPRSHDSATQKDQQQSEDTD